MHAAPMHAPSSAEHPLLHSLPELSIAAHLTHVCGLNPCRLSKIPREQRERRDALEEDEQALEYDVYGKFEYERENGKRAKAEWGRRWCPANKCAKTEDWEDKVKVFEMQLAQKRTEAVETYGSGPGAED